MKLYEYTPPPPLSQDYGPCCGCGAPYAISPSHLVIHMGLLAPEPGTGWGCVECGMPRNGALAVICRVCFDNGTLPCQVIRGRLGSRAREAVNPLAVLLFLNNYDHLPNRHRAYFIRVHGLLLDPAEREN